jgi:hypothetical protein
MKTFVISFVTTLLIAVFSLGSVQAQTFSANQKESLRGLNSMLLVVDFAQDAMVTDGLSRDDLELEIRRKLAGSGIRLMGEMEWARTEGVPYLYVYLNSLRSELGFYSYRAEVKLTQEVILKRNRGISQMSTTWETGTLGSIGVNRVESLRTEILELVDIFLADYKDVN